MFIIGIPMNATNASFFKTRYKVFAVTSSIAANTLRIKVFLSYIVLLAFISILLDGCETVLARTETVPKNISIVRGKSGRNIDEFYQTIIDNNIFRPLGWMPKKATFPYQLIGTIIYKGTQRKPLAIIQETTTNKKTHFVTLGDSLGCTTVIEIQNKKVALDKAGEKIILNITQQFLNLPQIVQKTVSAAHTTINRHDLKQITKLSDLSKIRWKSKTVFWDPSNISREEVEKIFRDGMFK